MGEQVTCGNFVHYFPTAERCACGRQEGYTLVAPSDYTTLLTRLAASERGAAYYRAALVDTSYDKHHAECDGCECAAEFAREALAATTAPEAERAGPPREGAE
jgi:hypothetical protein